MPWKTVIAFIVALALCTCALDVSEAESTASKRNFSVGDKWTYNITALIENFSINGRISIEIVNTANVVVNQATYDVIIEQGRLDGKLSDGAKGNFSVRTLKYYLKGNQSLLFDKVNLTIDLESEVQPARIEIINETTYQPPIDILQFPFSTGSTWVVQLQALTVIQKTETIGLAQNVSMSSETRALTVTSTVVGKENVVVPAGNFSAWVVKQSDQYGNSRVYYYSEIVKREVKLVAVGVLLGNGQSELVSTNTQPTPAQPIMLENPIFIAGIIILAAVVIATIAAIFYYGARRKPAV